VYLENIKTKSKLHYQVGIFSHRLTQKRNISKQNQPTDTKKQQHKNNTLVKIYTQMGILNVRGNMKKVLGIKRDRGCYGYNKQTK
jgi:hypothetical protein